MVRASEEVPMRISTVLFTMFAASTLALTACGGDDGGGEGDDDDDMDMPDAMPVEDMPDAMPEEPEQNAAGLGNMCDPAAADPGCPETTPECTFFAKGDPGFCSFSCGTAPEPQPGMDPEPPEGGQEACMVGYTGDATPACVVYGAAEGGQIPWSCGLLCGTFTPQGGQEVDFGTCPANLTCESNFCIP